MLPDAEILGVCETALTGFELFAIRLIATIDSKTLLSSKTTTADEVDLSGLNAYSV